jgi:transcriptional regulator with XRE-family HTH domain
MKTQRNNVLTNARKQLNLSQTEFAEQIGTSKVFYNEIERLKHFPSKEMQNKISKYLISNGIYLFEDELFPGELYGIEKPQVKFIGLNKIRENEIPYEENQFVEEINSEHLKNGIERVLNTLSYKDKVVLTSFFGLNEEEAKPLRDISSSLDRKVSAERVRQIKEKALKRCWGRFSFWDSSPLVHRRDYLIN